MSKISEEGYLFIHSGILEKEQIEKCFLSTLEYLSENYDKSFEECKMEINVVKNKEGKKYGHTYGWVSDLRFYFALIGKNFDGSERVELIPDEKWAPPDKDYEEAFVNCSGDWGDEDEIEESYKRPNIIKKIDPIITLPAIKYTCSQLEEINKESEYGFLEVFEVRQTKKSGKTNTLFSNNIPRWMDEKILNNYFSKFNNDITIHCDKKKKKKFQYPVISVKTKNDNVSYCTVTFSPLYPNTCSFLINICKRVIFEKENNSDILFFSQSKEK